MIKYDSVDMITNNNERYNIEDSFEENKEQVIRLKLDYTSEEVNYIIHNMQLKLSTLEKSVKNLEKKIITLEKNKFVISNFTDKTVTRTFKVDVEIYDRLELFIKKYNMYKKQDIVSELLKYALDNME